MDPSTTVSLSTDTAAQLAAAIKPDMWDRLLGPFGALVLAIAIVYVLWRTWEKDKARAIAREDAMIARVQSLEDNQKNVMTGVIQQNAVAFQKMADSNDAIEETMRNVQTTLERLPCNNPTRTPLPRA